MKQLDVAIGVVMRAGQILICQRRDGDSFGGFWEFPGGKCEDGETLEACLLRELREEVDIDVRVVERLASIHHEYPRVKLSIHPYLCEHISGEPRPVECQAVRWITAAELPHFRFPPANESLLGELQRRFAPM